MEDKSIKGSRTEQNLLASYAAKRRAADFCSACASAADSAGLGYIATVFRTVASHEQIHACRFSDILGGYAPALTPAAACAVYESGPLANLKQAAAYERDSWQAACESYARMAQEEEFPRVANFFRLIAGIDRTHESWFVRLHDRLSSGSEYEDPRPVEWICTRCGFSVLARTAPGRCPVCCGDRGGFMRRIDNL